MPRARETRPRDGGTEQYAGLEQAAAKLRELLNCGNERVELSAAKEILAMAETEAAKRAREQEGTMRMEVVIRIAE